MMHHDASYSYVMIMCSEIFNALYDYIITVYWKIFKVKKFTVRGLAHNFENLTT